jgi:YggT family protein
MAAWTILIYSLRLFEILIIVRIILSYVVSPVSRNPFVEMVRNVTDPILRPIRSVLPDTGMLDLSPMVAILLLQVLERVLISMMYRG